MTELKVENMTCNHCVGTVTKAVKSIDPSAQVQVDLENGRVRVEGRSAAQDLVKAIEEAGYPAAPVDAATPGAPRKSGCCGSCG